MFYVFVSKCCCVAPQASKRLESGEISQEDFLNMAHKIKHFFQYQEEKQQHSENWEDPGSFSKKPPLLTTPPAAQPCPHDTMDAAELSYYEHKSKLRKTQVTHRAAGEEWEGEETLEESGEVAQGEMTAGSRSHGHPPSHKYSRTRPGEQSGGRSRATTTSGSRLGVVTVTSHVFFVAHVWRCMTRR